MDRTTQVTLLRRLFDLHQAGSTTMADHVRHQPIRAYTDPEHLERELRGLFRGRPLVVGMSGDLPACGAYRAQDVAGVPALLVRGEDAVVRGFLNSCRHRGSRVAEGSGTVGRVFKCQYHSWCYDTHGTLVGQPLAQDAFAEVAPGALGLVPLPVAEVGGLLVLNPSAEAKPIDGASLFAGLGAELTSLALGEYTLLAEQHHVLACNWKQPYETFLESYHVFGLHRDTLSKQLLSKPMLSDFFGPHGRGVLMNRDTLALLDIDESLWGLRESVNLVYWLFPNAVLSLPRSGHAELWLTYPDPRDPSACRVHLKFYVPAADAEAREGFWRRMLDYTSKIVLSEDFQQQVRIQQGITSGSHPGLVFGRNEPALIHFHESLDAALDASSERRTARVHHLAPAG